MTTKKKRKPRKNLVHGAVEKEMRALHRKGAHVERQRDLTRALLHAVLVQLGGEVTVTREELDAGGHGTSGVQEAVDGGSGVRIVFTPNDDAPPLARPKVSRWRRFVAWLAVRFFFWRRR